MGHFLDYELFQPCTNCGRPECNGNDCRLPPIRISTRTDRPDAQELIRRQEVQEMVDKAVAEALAKREAERGK